MVLLVTTAEGLSEKEEVVEMLVAHFHQHLSSSTADRAPLN